MESEEPQTSLPEEDRADIRPDLRARERGGSTNTGERIASFRMDGDKADSKANLLSGDSGASTTGAGGGGSASSTSGLANNLAGAEKQAGDNFAFNPHDRAQRGNIGAVLRAAGTNRRALLFGGGVATGLVGLFVVIFFILVPLKLEHTVNNLQNRFFATSENAVGTETENLLSSYIKRSVLPAISKCSGRTIDKSCNPAFSNTGNPVDALFTGWQNARLESKLANNYGIEFRAVKHGSVTRYYMKIPGATSKAGDEITKFVGPGDTGDIFQQFSNRTNARAAAKEVVSTAMQDTTKWKQVMYRFKVGRLLEEKYGIKRCILFCGQRDQLADKADAKKNAAKILLTQRVIIPRTESMGIVMECLLDPSCHAEDTQPTSADPGTSEETAGAPENAKTDTAMRTTLTQLAASYGLTDDASINKMLDDYKNVSEKGYQKFVLEKVLGKIGLGELSGQVADKATIVGWVNQASNIIVSLKSSGPNIKKLAYLTNASAAVSTYMLYRSYADEVHTGKVNATEVGSAVDSLGPGNHGASTDPEVGGTASAESTPLYNAVINDGQNSSKTAMLDSFVPGAYAASTDNTNASSGDYRCADKKPPSGIVCPEEKLGGGSAAANSVTSLLSAPPLSFISDIASAWHSVFGGIFSFVGNIFGTIIGAVPGVNDLTSFVSKSVQPFFKFLTDQLIPNPFGSNMSGGRTFDMMAAGANVAGNDSCDQIGCQTVSQSAYLNIVNQQVAESRQRFNSQSLFARMFSTNSQYSLISRLALAMPSNVQVSTENGFASLISSPFSALSHGLASIFPGQKAFAGTSSTAAADPFNIGTKAFPADQIPADGQTYWNNHCSDNAAHAYQNDADYAAASWNDNAAHNPNPNTGMPDHSTTNPCLLLKQTVGNAGGLFDTSLLTQDEQSVLSGSLPSSQSAGTTQ